MNISVKVISDWNGKESTYLSLKSGDIIEVTENQVCIICFMYYYNCLSISDSSFYINYT